MSKDFDLLVRGGTVLDPAHGWHARGDIGLRDGRVVAVAPDLPSSRAAATLDASGQLVIPGLVDLHGHFFQNGFPSGASADATCLPSGVTTAIDAGSAGWVNYRSLLHHVIERCTTRVYAFVNLGGLGLLPTSIEVGELSRPEFVRVPETTRAIEENRSTLLGVKLRVDRRALGEMAPDDVLRAARSIADATRTRIMVHVAGSPVPFGRILPFLGPGDIVTHMLHGGANGLLNERGEILQEARAARERGVLFDIAHAGKYLDLEVARIALAQGFWPDTLSTDIHRPSPGGRVYSLLDVMSCFLALGMSVADVVARVTSVPGCIIGDERGIGTLGRGAVGDVAILRWEEGLFSYMDSEGHRIDTDRRLALAGTIIAGRIWRRDCDVR